MDSTNNIMNPTNSSTESADSQLQRACEDGNLQNVQQAVNSRPELTPRDLTCFASYAANGKHVEVVRYLLEKGASATQDPLTFRACEARSTDIFQAMYDHGWHKEQINVTMKSFGFLEMVTASTPAFKWLLDHGMDPNLVANRGMSGISGNMTPMNAAARYQAIEVMELLQGYGAVMEPDILDAAIWWREAASHSRPVLQWLVDHGADVNHPVQSGARLLHAATEKNNIELVTFLLENGASVHAKMPWNGQTALDLAREKRFQDVGDLLERYDDQERVHH